jgi:hypothetical protein
MRWWLRLIFMKFYLLMPFDAFNGSLVGQCLKLDCRTEISDSFTHSRKREGKITKMGQGVVTGLTGDMHRSDRCQCNQCNLGRWPGTGARVTRYASECCRVTRHECPGDPGLSKLSRRRVIWRQRLWGAKTHVIYQIIRVLWPSFGMSLNMFLIEQSALVEKFKFSSTT